MLHSHASSLPEALASLLQPPPPWHTLHGSLHVCALHATPDSSTLRTININEHSPKCAEDFMLLNLSRALSSVILQSLATVQTEGGQPAALAPHLAPALLAWRAAACHPQRFAAPGAHVLLTRGGRGPVPATLPLFGEGSGASFHLPYLAAPPAALPALLAAFGTGAARAAAPPTIAVPSHCLTLGHALCSLRKQQQQQPSCNEADVWLREVRAHLPLPTSLVTIEAGPTLTRPLYTLPPPGSAAGTGAGAGVAPAAQAEAEAWVATGDPCQACPVDYLLLSTLHHEGRGVAEEARGLALVRREVLEELFDVVASGSAAKAEGKWVFELMQRKGRAQSTLQGTAI
jgi:hypothetical protein